MKDMDRTVQEFARVAESRRYTRRQIVRAGVGLGFSAAAINTVLAMPAFAQDSSMSPAADGPVDVPLAGEQMSFDDIVAAIEAEGEVNVGNWTYTANDALIGRFQDYVSDVYAVDISLNYVGSQTPSVYLTDVFTAAGSGNESPYDILAIEENYWAEMMSQQEAEDVKLVEEFLPSGLIPNEARVMDSLKHLPTSVGFQSSASPGINYNSANVDFLNDWTDLADDRLEGKILMWLPGDITGGAILLGVAAAMGKDVSDPAQVQEVIDFLVDEVGPNAIKYTSDFSEAQQLFENEVVDVVTFWNSFARLQFLNGQEEAAFLVAESGQFAINGFMFMPANPSHPVLAQIFADWRLSDDAQFPDLESWGITEGSWAEFHEGFLGESYEALVPEWISDVYSTYFPTIDQLATQYKSVDWDVYNANASDWFDSWLEGIGL